VHWVYYSIHLFGHAVAPLAAAVTVLFVVGLALITSLGGLVYARLAPRQHMLLAALVFTAVWALMEWVRNGLFGGFPWLAIGYSQIDSWFSGYAPVVGVYGVGVALVLVCVMVVTAVLGEGTRQRVMAGGVAVVLVLAALVLDRVDWGEDKPDSLRVRMVQGNIEQAQKFGRDALRKTLSLYETLSRRGTGPQPDVIVWPETAIPTRFSRVEKALAPFVAEMEARDTVVLSGGFLRRSKTEVYNAFRELTGTQQTYLKSHLVPFGEFIPLRKTLNFLAQYIEIPMSDLSSGPPDQPPLAVKGERFGISICYEDVFGDEMRVQLPDATVLVNVSNDTWFGDSAAPHQHQEIAAMRAREFSRPLVRVTNTGISSFISARGEVLDSIAQFRQGTLDRDVTPRTGLTPYMVVGNYPVIVLFAVILAYAAWRRRRQGAAAAEQTHA